MPGQTLGHLVGRSEKDTVILQGRERGKGEREGGRAREKEGKREGREGLGEERDGRGERNMVNF